MENNIKNKLVFDNEYEVGEFVARSIHHAEAHHRTSEQLELAHKYANEYCMPEGWGRNVWHIILRDAIEIRKVYNPSPHAFDTDNICYKCGLEKANTGKYCRS